MSSWAAVASSGVQNPSAPTQSSAACGEEHDTEKVGVPVSNRTGGHVPPLEEVDDYRVTAARQALFRGKRLPSLPPESSLVMRSNLSCVFLADYESAVASLRHFAGKSASDFKAGVESCTAPTTTNFPPLRIGMVSTAVEAMAQSTRGLDHSRKARKRMTPSRVDTGSSVGGFGRNEDIVEKGISRYGSPSLSRRFSEKSDDVERIGEKSSESVVRRGSSLSHVRTATATPCVEALVKSEAIRECSTLHSSFMQRTLSNDHTLSKSLLTLVDALNLDSNVDTAVRDVPDFPMHTVFGRISDVYQTRAHFVAHAVLTLSHLRPVLQAFPSSLRIAFSENSVISRFLPGANSFSSSLRFSDPPLPKYSKASVFRRAGYSIDESANLALPIMPSGRLKGNFESMCDFLSGLVRRYRGASCDEEAGVVDRGLVIRRMGELHPAAVDAFAGRFVDVLLHECLTMVDDRNRRAKLSVRLTASTAVPTRHPSRVSGSRGHLEHAGEVRTGKLGAKAGSEQYSTGGGVVLHRIPRRVREMFSGVENFFLDFLDAADSARLNAALMPRLSERLSRTYSGAFHTITTEDLTQVSLCARLCGKFLSVCMHSSNWAHSSFSFSGDSLDSHTDSRANNLPLSVLKLRAGISSPTWEKYVPLSHLLKESISCGHSPALLVAVTVVDVILRIARVDPVATLTSWHSDAVEAIREILLYASDGDRSLPWVSNVAAFRCILEDLLFEIDLPHYIPHVAAARVQTQGVPDQQFGKGFSGLVSARVLEKCIPSLELLRKRLTGLSAGGDNVSARKRRIRPLAVARTPSDESELKQMRSVPDKLMGTDRVALAEVHSRTLQDMLWEEFWSRADKRVRGLITLVLESDPRTAREAQSRFESSASLLLMDVPHAIVRVSAKYCSTAFKKSSSSSSKCRRSGVHAVSESESDASSVDGDPVVPRAQEAVSTGPHARDACRNACMEEGNHHFSPSIPNDTKKATETPLAVVDVIARNLTASDQSLEGVLTGLKLCK